MELFFTQEHEVFRQSVRQFVEKEVVPNADEWEKNRQIPREVWQKMGDMGFLGLHYPETYGGFGLDFFYSVAMIEEISRATLGGFAAAICVHAYMATAHLAHAGSEALKNNYLAPAIAGQKIGALAITEPGGGSDVAALATTAQKDGTDYILNGGKTFITNGFYADFIVVACRTSAAKGVEGISLILVDKQTTGVTCNKLSKVGWDCSDTAEIFFDNVRVPQSHLIGKEGKGFLYIMDSFQLERLVGGIMAVAGAAHALEITLQYMNERVAFGKKLKQFQVLRHKIADMATELEAAKSLVYLTSYRHQKGEYLVKEASMVKLYASELGKKVVDECLQIFGGYGYMNDFVISRMYRDARVGTIVAGTSEIMREIIAKVVMDEVKYAAQYNEKPMEALSAKEIIASIPQRFRPEKASGVAMTVHFDITGEMGGQFTVSIENAHCVLLTGLVGTPNCVIEAVDSDYADIETGKIDPQMAFMTGKIKVSEVMQMMQFTRMFHKVSS